MTNILLYFSKAPKTCCPLLSQIFSSLGLCLGLCYLYSWRVCCFCVSIHIGLAELGPWQSLNKSQILSLLPKSLRNRRWGGQTYCSQRPVKHMHWSWSLLFHSEKQIKFLNVCVQSRGLSFQFLQSDKIPYHIWKHMLVKISWHLNGMPFYCSPPCLW
jgi:hypothetical protein